MYVLFGLSRAIFVYGGYPFLKGLMDEIRSASPGMMTLIEGESSINEAMVTGESNPVLERFFISVY